MAAKQKSPALVLSAAQEHGILEARVMSSKGDTEYNVILRLSTTILCTCPANRMRDSKCEHVKRALGTMDADELRELILDSHYIP